MTALTDRRGRLLPGTQSAFHEAGHAVAAWVTGRDIILVALGSAPALQDDTSKMAVRSLFGGDDVHGFCAVKNDGNVPHINRLIFTLGGWCAEQLLFESLGRKPWRWGYAADLASAEATLAEPGCDVPDLESARWGTEQLLRCAWPEVTEVADALRELGALTGRAVTNLIGPPLHHTSPSAP